MKRFKNKSLALHDPPKEQVLVKYCLEKMHYDYRLLLINLDIPTFQRLVESTGNLSCQGRLVLWNGSRAQVFWRLLEDIGIIEVIEIVEVPGSIKGD